MKLSNRTMDEYYNVLFSLAEKTTGKLGYAVSRNLRKLTEELVEYQTLKDKAIRKYGQEDDDGITRIKIGSDEFNKYINEMKEYMDIEHDVQLFFVSGEDVINSSLNAKEMLSIDFMVEKEGSDG